MQPIVSLDLGTTKFCIALLRKQPGAENVTVDTLCVPAEGMCKGMLGDFKKSSAAIKKLIAAAKETYGLPVGTVVTGVAGSHLSSRIIQESCPIHRQVITPSTLAKLTSIVEQKHRQENREILHTVPLHYQVDGREHVDDPTGFSGERLYGTYFLIDADYHYLRDVVRVCNIAGLEVSRLYAEPFASACVTLDEDEKNRGVVLADIGGGTTDGVVFAQGRPCHLFSINVAGKLMTSDLVAGLNIPHDQAERAKLAFGLQREEDLKRIETLDFQGQVVALTWKDAYPILAPRIRELGQCLLKASQFGPQLRAGIKLTGGGSQVRGIVEFLKSEIKAPIQLAAPSLFPQEIDLPKNQFLEVRQKKFELSSKYATVLGLLNLEISKQREMALYRRSRYSGRYLSKFVNWIREMS